MIEFENVTRTYARTVAVDGLTLRPVVLLVIEKGVFPPPGSTIVRVWVETDRSQKLPRNTMSRCVAVT